jgi:endonuclease-3
MYSRCTPARRARLAEVLTRLTAHNPAPVARPRRWSALDLLVLALLSQNTNMSNSRAGFKQLRRAFPTWSAVMTAAVDDVQRHIAICGLARMRARRLQALLRRVKSDQRKLSLQSLKDMAPDDAYDYLLSFHGIGPKTAAYTLLFAFDMPLFPVDHGIWRTARRLHLVRPKAPEPETTRALTRLCSPGQHYPLHVLLFAHAKSHCRPRNPKCRTCPLLTYCPTGQSRLRHRPTEPATLPPKKSRARILAAFASAGIPVNGRDDESTRPDLAPRLRPVGAAQRPR